MARIRTIKPEFWTNDKILSIAPLTRLMFIGMWNFADDYGRMDYAPLTIKARIFPTDATTSADVSNMLNELCSHDLITIYSAKGKEYIEITGWDHQRIDKRQSSKIPAPYDDGCSIRGIPPTSPDPSPTPAPVMEGNGKDRNGREGKEDTREVALRRALPSSEFELFWNAWPNKVGKPAAQKAYLAATGKRGAWFDEIMAGLQAYIRDKPPDRPWLNPATFLNQNRWEDRPAPVAKPLSAYQAERETGREILDALSDASSRQDSEVLRQASGAGPEDVHGGSGGNLIELSARRIGTSG